MSRAMITLYVLKDWFKNFGSEKKNKKCIDSTKMMVFCECVYVLYLEINTSIFYFRVVSDSILDVVGTLKG